MTETLSLFFALLAFGGAATVVTVGVGVGVLALDAPGGDAVAEAFESIRPLALPLAMIVAVTATAGSLYYSEGAGYDPCQLCWVQRGFMYPSAAILTVAVLARKPKLGWIAFGLSCVGLAVSVFHRLEQAFPESVGGACAVDNPCSGRYVEEFGFVTIPTMAAVAFALVIVLVPLALWRPSS